MQKWLFGVSAAVATVAVLGACGGGAKATPTATAATKAVTTTSSASATATAAAPASPTDLVATKKAPASLAVDDAAWKDAAVTPIRTILIGTSKATEAKTVNVQALYNDTDVWFRFEWPDATQKDTDAFSWDGGKWIPPSGKPDRLSLNWEIAPIADFEAKGCQGICHRSTTDPIDKWYMIAPKAGELIDNWQWTPVDTGPVGQAKDYTITGGELPDPKVLESSIVGDKLDSGGYASNATTAPAAPGPVKMQDPSKPPTYGAKYLAPADAIPLDMSKVKAGDTIPRRTISPFVGSRGDIQAKHAYAAGKWTVVFHRKLDTGHTDDVKFVTSKSYPFGLAVFNDLDHFNHTVSEGAFMLKFKTN